MAEKLKQRADGRYARQVVIGLKDGKPVKKTVYGRTQAEVNKKYRQLLNEIDSGSNVKLLDITVSQLCDQWFTVTKKGSIKPQSETFYTLHLNTLKNAIGNRKMKDIRDIDLKQLLDSIVAKGHPAKAKACLKVFRAVSRYAIGLGIISRDPSLLLTIRYTPKHKRILTELEKKRIEKAELPLNEKAMIYLLLYTGMRIGEVCALTKSDIDLKKRVISINKTIVFSTREIQTHTKTSAGMRKIPIFEPLYPILCDYMASLNQDYLFWGSETFCYRSLQYRFTRTMKDIGITDSLTFHVLRHTFISDCYRAGVPLKQTQLWVGHSDAKITLDIYTHLETDDIMETSAIETYYARKSNGSQIDSSIQKTLAD